MSWLTGWITSCFLSCFYPYKNDHDRVSSPRVIVRNMTFDKRKNENFNNIYDNNLSQSSTTSNNVYQNDDSSWSFFSDEDFIVYGFEKDGPFDIVKDDKGMHKYARPVLLKPKYNQNPEKISEFDIHNKSSNVNQCDKRSNVNQCDIEQQDQNRINPSKEGEGEEKEIKHKHDNKGRVYHVEINEDYEIMSVESRNSIQSEDNTGSFTFPVLDCEWIGTPERMPKSEGAPWVTLTLPIMVHAMERLWKFQAKGMVLELSSTTPKEA
ncbi:hypothetical protein P8452_44196 [Trifolium repens]|nr:hypothetical protein P8452_44196 [Trifolium repens]